MNFNKILFINSPKNDFLADSFLIGLKNVFPGKVYEWKKNKFIYKSPQKETEKMHGIGFTLYHLLDESTCMEYNEEFSIKEFDLIIFGDIYRQSEIYLKIKLHLHFKNTIILDGEDTPAIYPYYFAPWKKPYSFLYPKLHKRFVYYKREIIARRTNYYRFYKLIPKFLATKINLPKNLIPISFSIPSNKITETNNEKIKLFGKHIVDDEVCKNVEGSVTKYAFNNEKDYYLDLQKSKFGITTKRGGWDCLRHYEIAANGAVICFKNLHLKESTCAPHGLLPMKNCLSYSNFSDLSEQISKLSDSDYRILQENSLEWVKSMSCENLVRNMILDFTKRTEP